MFDLTNNNYKSFDSPGKQISNMSSNRTVPIITIIAILSLTFVFFQGECKYFEWGKLADDEKIANFFTSFEAIFVAATLFYIGRQLEESRLARLKSYEPLLMPLQSTFYWRVIDMATFNFLDPLNNDTQFAINKLLVGFPEFRNVGNGIARNVRMDWEYDSDLVRRKILLLYVEERLIWNSEGDKAFEQNVVLVEQQTIFFAPSFYLLMWSDEGVYLRTALNRNDRSTPPLYLNLSFKDKDGNTIRKRYEAHVSIEDVDDKECVIVNYVDLT